MSDSHLIFSEPCIIVPQSPNTKPLGSILQEADLVSSAQIEVALKDQKDYRELKIGEILALRGWLKQETADFFVRQWPSLVQQKQEKPLGYYLKAAGLLDEEQIHLLLCEQEQIGLRLGALAVLKGWIKPTTLDYFLKNLCPDRQSEAPFVKKAREDEEFSAREQARENTLTEDTMTEETLDKDTWTEEEDRFEQEIFDDDDGLTQIIIPRSTPLVIPNPDPSATLTLADWYVNSAMTT
jgi:hypothetical protein